MADDYSQIIERAQAALDRTEPLDGWTKENEA